ncbi:MAG: hypothetical protein IPJ20_00060 [Flammeovirgaceae bacterium]|nr:hypothetical protein [Flammeovirgaceae bacterium]
MKKQTICTAAIQALKSNDRPMNADEIYDFIIKNDLYKFKAKSPKSILRAELRRHTSGVLLRAKKGNDLFKLNDSGLYIINSVN